MSMPALFKGRLSLPVIGAPLFIISVPDLVIAQCKAGIVGSFPALNARPAALLDEWLHRITEELAAHDKAHPDRLSAPFAVNQIVHKSNARLDQDLAVCEKHKVKMMITSLGAREELNQAAHAWGGIVFHDVINQKFAHKAVEKGADGLILVSAGAGGHAGELSPFAFVAETREWFDGPVALSGAIGHGPRVLQKVPKASDRLRVGRSRRSDAHEARPVRRALRNRAAPLHPLEAHPIRRLDHESRRPSLSAVRATRSWGSRGSLGRGSRGAATATITRASAAKASVVAVRAEIHMVRHFTGTRRRIATKPASCDQKAKRSDALLEKGEGDQRDFIDMTMLIFMV